MASYAQYMTMGSQAVFAVAQINEELSGQCGLEELIPLQATRASGSNIKRVLPVGPRILLSLHTCASKIPSIDCSIRQPQSRIQTHTMRSLSLLFAFVVVVALMTAVQAEFPNPWLCCKNKRTKKCRYSAMTCNARTEKAQKTSACCAAHEARKEGEEEE